MNSQEKELSYFLPNSQAQQQRWVRDGGMTDQQREYAESCQYGMNIIAKTVAAGLVSGTMPSTEELYKIAAGVRLQMATLTQHPRDTWHFYGLPNLAVGTSEPIMPGEKGGPWKESFDTAKDAFDHLSANYP